MGRAELWTRTAVRAVVGVAALATTAALAGCSLGGTTAGASSPPASSAAPAVASSDRVTAAAFCGVRQVYWRGSWWQVGPTAAPVRGEGEQREVTGTMTLIGPGQARLDSPQLVGSETLTDSGSHQAQQPPTPRCAL